MGSTYYQVTQITMDNRSRLQKLRNMSKMKVIMKAANEAMGEIQGHGGQKRPRVLDAYRVA
jgi:hypothetical protein